MVMRRIGRSAREAHEFARKPPISRANAFQFTRA